MWEKFKSYGWLVLFFGLIVLIGYWLKNQTRGWEIAVLLVRRKEVGIELRLPFFWEWWWKIYAWVGEMVIKFDDLIPYFPSLIKELWWKESIILIFVWMPVLLVIVGFLSLWVI